MSSPRVSVVLSVYNGEQHLPDSLGSILAQTFTDLELIAVNDGSQDRSLDILREFQQRDPRLRVIDQPNAGLTRALIAGCAQARGEYIARQDADDWSFPHRIEQQVRLIESSPEIVMVSCWAEYIGDGGELIQRIERPLDPQLATQGLLYERQGPPAHGTMLFRRRDYEKLGGYRACFYYSQDSDLWLRLANLGRIAYVGEPLYRARLSANGISSVRSNWQLQFGELGQLASAARLAGESDAPIVAQAEELCRQLAAYRQNPRDAFRLQSAALYRMGTMLSRQGNQKARDYFWSAIRVNPWHWRSWCRLSWEVLRPQRGAKTT